MTAIVTGNGLGLTNTSLGLLGNQGQLGQAQQGRSGEGVYVNAATGNLVVQQQDEWLIGLGPDANITRTYNSLAASGSDGDNNDNWRLGLSRKIYGFTGTQGSGSVKRVGEDGVELVYTWSSAYNAYVNQDGGGSYDTITWDGSSNWIWTDGDSRTKETYEVTNATTKDARLKTVADADGNALTLSYTTGGLVSQVTTSKTADGNTAVVNETVYIDYFASTSDIQRIRTVKSDGTVTRTNYTYDAAHRLSTVTVDLSPNDSSTTDNNALVTTYTYVDSTSRKLATLTQSVPGQSSVVSSLSFDYDGSGRIWHVTESLTDHNVNASSDSTSSRQTTFTYAAGQTTVQDALGQQTVLTYDASNRLTQIKAPAVGGVNQTTNFAYNTGGDVTSVTDARGGVSTFNYDARGNRTYEQDASGRVTTRTFDANNQILSQTVYTTTAATGATPAASTAQTTYYAYDGESHLRYIVSPEGRVTEHRYNGVGQRTATLLYTASTDVLSAQPTTAALDSWVTALSDKTKAQRTDYSYGTRGELTNVKTYSTLDANGNGIVAAVLTSTTYSYDQAGNLLSRTTSAGTTNQTSTYAYDGLNRVTLTTDGSGNNTVTLYTDTSRQTRVTLANGFVVTSTYDQNGHLLKTVGAGTDGSTTQTDYRYDALGRLLYSRDALGRCTYHVYDAANRLVGDVDPDGYLTEYRYNADNQVTATIRWTNAISVTTLSNLNAGTSDAASLTLSDIRPAADIANDRISRNIYDASGHLVMTIDPVGAVVSYQYDGAGRLTDTTAYATLITSQLTNLANATGELGSPSINSVTVPGGTNFTVGAVPTSDRHTRNYYSADGLLVGTVDGENYYTKNVYDAGGRLGSTTRYATVWDGATLAAGLPSVAPNTTNDQTTTYYYTGNLLSGVVDAEGYLTKYTYYQSGQKKTEIRFVNCVVGALGASLPSVVSSVPGSGTYVLSTDQDLQTTYTYDQNGRLVNRMQGVRANIFQGDSDHYAYDTVGNAVESDLGIGSGSEHDLRYTYDQAGRLTGELNGEGGKALSAWLAAHPSATTADIQAQTNLLLSQYGTRYAYDAAGQRISAITSDGQGGSNKTVYYYEADGRLSYRVDGIALDSAGVVKTSSRASLTQYVYNRFGELTQERHVANFVTDISAQTALAGGADSVLTTNTLLNTEVKNRIDTGASSLDSVVQTVYNGQGLATTLTDANGEEVLRTYTAFGQLKKNTGKPNQDGVWLNSTYTYDRRGLVTKVLDNSVDLISGYTALHVYDAFGRDITDTDRTNKSTQIRYDRLGRVVQVTDRTSVVRNSTFDAFGRVLTSTDALGKTTSYSYARDENDFLVTTLTTPENVTTITKQDAFGHVLSVQDNLGNVTNYSYNHNGDLLNTSLTAAGSATPLWTTSVHYDTAGRVDYTTDARSSKTTTTYDASNRVLSRVVDAGGLNLTTTYLYDAKGQPTWTQDPNGTWTHTEYDLLGQVAAVTVDPLSIPSGIDPSAALIANAAGKNLRTEYTYDAIGQTLSVTEAAGSTSARKTAYHYDWLGRRIQEVIDPTPDAPDGTTHLNLLTSYTYDVNNNVTAKTDANGNVTRYVYDAESRLTYTVDATGSVSKTEYDANGRVTRSTAYATRIAASNLSALSTSPTEANVTSALAAADANYATNSANHVGINTYDQDGRLRYSVDALNHVTLREYDAAGNVAKLTRYATAAAAPTVATNPSGVPATFVSFTVTAPTVDLVNDQVEQYVYDGANRLAFKIDAMGYVTQNTYDANSNVTQVTRYYNPKAVQSVNRASPLPANEVAITGSGLIAGDITVVKNTANDQTTTTYYDKANRATSSVDAEGYLTQRSYDNDGHLTLLTRYGAKLSGLATLSTANEPQVNPATTPTDRPYLVSSAANDAVTQYLYDKAGRLTDTTEAFGTTDATTTHQVYDQAGRVTDVSVAWGKAEQSTTHYDYDAAGRVIAETKGFNRPLNSADRATTRYTLDGLGNRVKVTDPNGAEGYFYFNANNQGTWHVDPMGYAVQTTYDAFGNVSTITRYVNGVKGSISAANVPVPYDTTAPTSGSYVKRNNDPVSGDQTTTIYHDKLNRQIQITDAAGYNEYQTYDALGNKDTVTNKLNGVTTYKFDRVGNVVQEKLPAQVYHYNADGTPVLVTDTQSPNYGKPQPFDVFNTYTYDARGNKLTSTEDSGPGGVSRVTNYTYDTLNRLVTQTSGTPNAITWYDSTGAHTGSAASTQTRTYDARGNVIEIRDLQATNLWSRALVYYDALNRKVAEVSATGTLTAYSYNAAGDMTSQRIYGDAISLPPTAGGNAPSATNANNVRETTYTYDAGHRQLTTSQANVQVGEVDPVTGNYEIHTQNLVTSKTYDYNGNVLSETDARGNTTWHYYDTLGNQIIQLDAERYVTYWTYDANGNVNSETRYDTQLADNQPVNPSTTMNLVYWVNNSGGYRETLYARDKMGRVVTQTVSGYDAVTGNSGIQATTIDGNGAVNTTVSDATTSYQYNGMGQATQKTEATGEVLNWVYDQQGRLVTAKGSTFAGFNNSTQREITATEYNSLGLVARSIEKGATADQDRISRNLYNSNGLLTSTIDAAGVVTQYTYDAAGRITSKSLVRSDADSLDAKGSPSQWGKLWVQAHPTSPTATTSTTLSSAANLAITTFTAEIQIGALSDVRDLQIGLTNGLTGTSQRQFFAAIEGNTVKAYYFNGSTYQGVTLTANGGATLTAGATYVVTINLAANAGSATVTVADKATPTKNWSSAAQTLGSWGTNSGINISTYNINTNAYPTPPALNVTPSLDYIDNITAINTVNSVSTTTFSEDFSTLNSKFTQTTTATAADTVVAFKTVDAQGNTTKPVTDLTTFSYDLSGQQIQQVVQGVQTQETQYNAYGEITGKRTSGPNGPVANAAWQERIEYDSVGRVWRSNSGDGVTKVYVYDANGNATLTITPTGSMDLNVAGQTPTDILTTTDIHKNISVYNKKNNLTNTLESTIYSHTQPSNPTNEPQPASQPIGLNGIENAKTNEDILNSEKISPITDHAVLQGAVSGQLTNGRLNWSPAATVYGSWVINIPDTSALGNGNIVVIFPGGQRMVLPPTARSFNNDQAHTAFGFEPAPQYANNDFFAIPTIIDGEYAAYINGVGPFKAAPSPISIYKNTDFGNINIADIYANYDGLRTVYGYDYAGIRPTPAWDLTVYNKFTSNKLLIRNQPPSTSKVIIEYKPNGASTWSTIEANPINNSDTKPIPGSYTFDMSELSWGTTSSIYNIRSIALNSQGEVLSIESSDVDLRLVSNPAISQSFKISGGAGHSFLDSTGNLNFAELGNTPRTAALKYRVHGTSGVWTPASPDPTLYSLSGSSIPGWFQYKPPALTPGATYDYILETFDTNGKQVTKVLGQFGMNADGTTVNPALVTDQLQSYTDLPQIVHFQNLPANTARAVVRYTAAGVTRSADLIQDSPGSFTWDTLDLSLSQAGSTTYSVQMQAFDAAGRQLSGLNSTVTLSATSATPANVTNPGNPATTGQIAIYPPFTNAAAVKLYYKLITTGAYTSITSTTKGSDGRFVFDLSGLLPTSGDKTFDYYYEAYNNATTLNSTTLLTTPTQYASLTTVPTYAAKSRFTLSAATAAVAQTVLLGVANPAQVSRRSQTYNAYGEIVTQTDALGNETQLAYNALGKLIDKTDPTVSFTDEHGYASQAAPHTHYDYDLQGRLVQTIDANLHATKYTWIDEGSDGQSHAYQEFHADGGLQTSVYDVFGDLRQTKNSISQGATHAQDNSVLTGYDYDALGRVVKVTHAQRTALPTGSTLAPDTYNQVYVGKSAVDTYAYDEAGNRISHSNTDGTNTFTDKTFYDALGRVIKTVSAQGRTETTAYTFDNSIKGVGGATVGGWHKVNVNALNADDTKLISDTAVTLPNTLIDDTDLFGHNTKHTDLGGHVFVYSYNAAGWLTDQKSKDGTAAQNSGQDIHYDYYSDGKVKDIIDNAQHTNTLYEYDKQGNKTFEGYATQTNGFWNFYQQSTIKYDALNRITTIADAQYTTKYEYDLVGNRRRVQALLGSDTTPTQDYWYAYDSMNRFTVTMGKLVTTAGNSDSVVAGTVAANTTNTIQQGVTGKGVRLTYDLLGQRTSATYALDGRTESYDYTADGFLTRVRRSDTWVASARKVNLLGQVESLTENSSATAFKDEQTFTYDKDGKVTQSTYRDASATTTTVNTLAGDGTLKSSRAGTTTTSYKYAFWDSAVQSSITAKQDQLAEQGQSTFAYDVNGHITQVFDVAGNRTLRYTNNAQGLIMQRDEIGANNTVNLHENYYYFDGQRVGETGNDAGSAAVDYAQALATAKVTDSQAVKAAYRNPRPITSDFDSNYQPINSSYPGFSSTGYVVRGGEKLEDIANAVWGDSSLWYLIADANGLSNRTALTAGQTLIIPNKVTNVHNSTSTHAVYDAGAAMGDTSPTMPDPPAPPKPAGKKGCGGIGMILMVVVAVVASVVTAGLALAAIGAMTGTAAFASVGAALASGTLGGFAAGVAAATVGAAAGSIASQLVGMATGDVQHFSWSAVTRAAGSGALSAGITGVLGGGVSLGSIVDDTTTAMRNYALSAGVRSILGQRAGFSWKGMAASAVGGALNSVANSSEFGNGAFGGQQGGQIFRDTVAGLANGEARSLIFNEQPHWQAIAANSFGGAVGGALTPWASSLGKQLGDAIVQGLAQEDGRSLGSGLSRKNDPWADKVLNLPSSPLDDSTAQLGLYGLGSSPGQAAPKLNQVGIDTTTDNSTAQKNWDDAVAKVDAMEWRAAEKARVAQTRAQQATRMKEAAQQHLPLFAGSGDANIPLPLLGGGGDLFTTAQSSADQMRQAQVRRSLDPNLLIDRAHIPQPPSALQQVWSTSSLSLGDKASQTASLIWNSVGDNTPAPSYGTGPDAPSPIAMGFVKAGVNLLIDMGELFARSFDPATDFSAAKFGVHGQERLGVLAFDGAALVDAGYSARNIFSNSNISGAASFGRAPATWGKTPQATEFLYTQNRTSPLSIEDALNQADEFGAFKGNLVDYEVLPNGSVTVDHGGGLSINYQAVPDKVFDAFHGPNRMAAYRTPEQFAPNKLISWDDAFEDGVVNVHIRQSTLLSDRGAVAAFGHEYGELQTVYNKVGNGSYMLGKWDSFINGAHEQVVPHVDNIIGSMIVSGGR